METDEAGRSQWRKDLRVHRHEPEGPQGTPPFGVSSHICFTFTFVTVWTLGWREEEGDRGAWLEVNHEPGEKLGRLDLRQWMKK